MKAESDTDTKWVDIARELVDLDFVCVIFIDSEILSIVFYEQVIYLVSVSCDVA